MNEGKIKVVDGVTYIAESEHETGLCTDCVAFFRSILCHKLQECEHDKIIWKKKE